MTMNTQELPLQALEQAISRAASRSGTDGLIRHSDHGTQCTGTVYATGVMNDGMLAVDRHRPATRTTTPWRKRRRRVQDRAGMAAQTLRGSEGPGIGDVPVGLVVELEAPAPVPGLQDTRSGGN